MSGLDTVGPYAVRKGRKPIRETRPRERERILHSAKPPSERAVGPSHGEIKKVTVEMWKLLLNRGSRLFIRPSEVELGALKTLVKAILSTEGDAQLRSKSLLQSILADPRLDREKLLRLAEQVKDKSGGDLARGLDNFIKAGLGG